MSVTQWKGLCSTCGQVHVASEPHLYNYGHEVDEDLTCHICLQPLVSPTDTKCGHTFCRACLTNYLRLQHQCPIDRQPLGPRDCQPASLMVRRLLDKLEVECPNVALCRARLPRSELEPHLRNRCPGAVFSCPQASFGCAFQGLRHQLERHVVECRFDEQRNVATPAGADSWLLEGQIGRVEIRRNASGGQLGMSIVGGYDSPLRCIIVQEIHEGGCVAKHGQLQPGDQLLEVNGKDLTHCSHSYVVNLLSSNTCQVLVLSVYREQVDPPSALAADATMQIVLDKSPGSSLGIKLTEKRHQPGVFIADLVEGSVAATDGRLRPDDRILEINSQDVRRSKIEEASLLIQTASQHIELVVSRSATEFSRSSGSWRGTPPPLLPPQCRPPSVVEVHAPPLPPRNTPPSSSCSASVDARPSPSEQQQVQPRYVTITKKHNESLGIRVAGGLESQQGNTPVYIQNIAPLGCLGRSHFIKKGDILLSVNLTSLLGIAHSEAVAALKVATNTTNLTLGIVDGPETSYGPDPFTPTWMYWQNLPRALHLTKTVTLHRSSSNESLGFSLVGGKDGVHGEHSFHVLLVVKDSIADKDGKLRCGDQILSVNGHRLDGLRHAEAVNLLKQTRCKVLLEILSWPGTIV